MSFADSYAAANDAGVQAQVETALRFQASVVYSEGNSTPGHSTRAAFATQVLNGDANLQALVYSIVAYGQLTTSSADADVTAAVAALWSPIAGA